MTYSTIKIKLQWTAIEPKAPKLVSDGQRVILTKAA